MGMMYRPSMSSRMRSSPDSSTILAGNRLDWPRKLATNAVFGDSYKSVRGRSHLLNDTFVHHRDGVGHGHGLLLVVGDVDEREADFGLDALELQLHLSAQFQVQGSQRFIEQQHRRTVDDRAGKSDPLLLTTGELSRLPFGHRRQLDELQGVVDLLLGVLHAPRRFRPNATFSKMSMCGNRA